MKLFLFLEQFYCTKTNRDYHTICFYGAGSNPILFFSLFFSQLKKQRNCTVESIDVREQESVSVKASLAICFLGNPVIYWLRGLDELEIKRKKYWLTYLRSYQGPNTVLFFVSQESKPTVSKTTLVVEIPNEITPHEITSLLVLFDTHVKDRVAQCIKHLSIRYKSMPLDTACVLAQYSCVVGNSRLFFDQWLPKIIEHKTSLFTLSQYLFAKKSASFFTQWKQIMTQYSEQFWIVFWSEQIYRASMYTQLMKQGNRTEAQKIKFKLPFSFINYDWRRYQPAELKKAHQFIYDVDYKLKNGGSAVALDLFYTKFLSNQFQKN